MNLSCFYLNTILTAHYNKRGELTIARKPRNWTPGTIFHIMERGVRRQTIFHDEIDYKFFVSIMRTAAADYECLIHAYCLMPNHFHLLLETGNINMGDFMRSLASRYAIFYNLKYKQRGHVFESRYKSCLVDTDEYFLQVSRYIHLNPVKANMVRTPESYPWSSYKYMFTAHDDEVMKHDKTLNYFSPGKKAGYKEFVERTCYRYDDAEKEIMHAIGENEACISK